MALEYGKLEKFSCKFIKNLVRIGNVHPENPNHFWNAIFYGFKSYRDLSQPEKYNYIESQRDYLSSKITKQEWLHYSDGFHSHRQITSRFRDLFLKSNDKIYSPSISIILKLITNKEIFLEKCMEEYEDHESTLLIDIMSQEFIHILPRIEHQERKTLSKDKKTKCEQLFKNFMTDLWNQATDDSFNDFIQCVKDINISIPFFMIPLVLTHLDFHVFFFDYKSGDILSLNDYYETMIEKNPKVSCVFILYDGQSYESLGVIDDEENGNMVKIHRLFKTEDPIPQLCYKRIIIDNQ